MTLNKYISFGAVAMLAVAGLSSCDGKNDPLYIPAASVSEAQRVFFAEDSYTEIVTAEDTYVDVLVYRPDLNVLEGNTSKADMPAQTVKILANSSAGPILDNIFSVPSEVTFEAGSPNATIRIDFDPANMKGNHYYPIQLTIAPEYANEYARISTIVRINKEEYTEWEPFAVGGLTEERNGTGTYTFGGFYYGGTEDPVRVLARSVPTNPDDIQFQFQWLTSEDPNSWATFMTASTKDGGETVTVPEQHFANNADYGAVYVMDTYTYSDNANFKGLTKFDPETGLFTLNVVYYCSAGRFGNGDEFLQLRGYADMNVYELTVSAQGQMEVGGKDYEMVSFSFTEAVNYVDYTVVEGELDEEEVNAVIEIITDPEQTEYPVSTINTSQNVALTFPSSGNYTVVAVGYHEAADGTPEAKCSAYASFSYTTFDPYAGWKKVTDNAVFNDNLISWLYMEVPTPMALTVRVDQNEEHESLFRITNPYADFADELDIASFGSILFEVRDEDHINFPMSEPGIIYNGTPIQICSFANFYMMNDTDASDIPAPYWGTWKDDVITLNAFNMSDAAPFVLFLGQQAYYLDIDFSLDLKGAKAAGMPRAKNLTDIITRQMMPVKATMKPAKAFYKAVPQGAPSGKLDRTPVKALKLRK